MHGARKDGVETEATNEVNIRRFLYLFFPSVLFLFDTTPIGMVERNTCAPVIVAHFPSSSGNLL